MWRAIGINNTIGDGNICGDESCEDDVECAAGQVCNGCACENPPLCSSGIVIDKPSMKLVGETFMLRLRGSAGIPKPWSGIDPLANGARVIVGGIAGAAGECTVLDWNPPTDTRPRCAGDGTRLICR